MAGLETREKVIEWQVDLRQRQQHVQRLEITSRQLEMYQHQKHQRA